MHKCPLGGHVGIATNMAYPHVHIAGNLLALNVHSRLLRYQHFLPSTMVPIASYRYLEGHSVLLLPNVPGQVSVDGLSFGGVSPDLSVV